MTKKWAILGVLLAFAVFISYLFLPSGKGESKFEYKKLSHAEKLALYHQYDIDRTKDPRTGIVPVGIREKVLDFISGIPSRKSDNFAKHQFEKIGEYEEGTFQWKNLGPENIGGRMNCIEFDINNENIILAGAASGGVWRSIDGGKSWSKTTSPNQIQSVYCLTQDKRAGKTNIWYYGTGELLSTIDRRHNTMARMSYPGNGIFKSTDNGLTWTSLKSTQAGFVGKLTENFQGVWKIIPDNTNTDQDVIFAACLGGIMKSTDGGTSWTMVLGDNQNKAFSTDLEIAKDGTLYAALGKISITGNSPKYTGIYRSTDKGNTWTSFTPKDFPMNTKVIKLGLAPVTNNYLYAAVDIPYSGKDPYTFQASYLGLWSIFNPKTNSNWNNLTTSLDPNSEEVMTPATLGGYALAVKVAPYDENSVFLGGTSLYRSTDNFTTNTKVSMIGGYYYDNGNIRYDLSSQYLHPDIHNFIFLNSNKKGLYAVSDGGVYYTSDISKLQPDWQQKNDGLITSQFYSIAMSKSELNPNFLVGGLQDNGTFCLGNKKQGKQWMEVFGGDGMPTAISKNMDFVIATWYNGNMMYVTLNKETYEPERGYYASAPLNNDSFDFFTVFQLSPIDNNTIFLAQKNNIWYNQNLDLISTSYENYSNSWNTSSEFNFPEDEHITTMKMCDYYEDCLFAGTNAGKVYLLSNVSNPDQATRYDLTGNSFPQNGWVSAIEIDEKTGAIFVTFSNYNVQSIFASFDTGETWSPIGGNLEEFADGTGAGPSVRYIKSINLSNNHTYYFVGTDVGLFSTDKLDGDNTVWYQEGKNTIGNVIVERIDTYGDEVAIATQGAGIFSGELPNSVASSEITRNQLFQNYPNPVNNFTQIKFYLNKPDFIQMDICDLNGRPVQSLLDGYVESGVHNVKVDAGRLSSGIYMYYLKTSEGILTKKILIRK